MIDWKNIIENGKKNGIEYVFHNDIQMNNCSCCGGEPKIYEKNNTNKKLSFSHIFIRCEKCGRIVSSDFDISGNPSEMYPSKENAIQKAIKEWENK